MHRDFLIVLYYISNKGLVAECDKEETLAVIGAATSSCFQRRLYNTLFKVTYSPCHRQAGAPMMNIQSTIRTAPDLCKNVLLAAVFGSRGDLYTVCTQSYTECPRRNVPNFGKVFLMLKYTDITQNTYVQRWTVKEIMAKEVWNFDSCYTLVDYQIHIKTGRNMWFL